MHTHLCIPVYTRTSKIYYVLVLYTPYSNVFKFNIVNSIQGDFVIFVFDE